MKVGVQKWAHIQLIKIDPKRNLLYVKGCVPGNDGEYVKVTDGRDIGPFELPFPTWESEQRVMCRYIPTGDEKEMEEVMAPAPAEDPYPWY